MTPGEPLDEQLRRLRLYCATQLKASLTPPSWPLWRWVGFWVGRTVLCEGRAASTSQFSRRNTAAIRTTPVKEGTIARRFYLSMQLGCELRLSLDRRPGNSQCSKGYGITSFFR